MSSINRFAKNIKARISFFALAVVAGATPSYALDLTAGNVMSDMPVAERTMFISGIVHGLAYARFRNDTLASGERDQTGMECILQWFGTDRLSRLMEIEATFEAYAGEYPPTVLAAMVKQECAE